MSATKRVQVNESSLISYFIVNSFFNYIFQQWATLSRMWYLFDAQWQDPFHSAKVLSLYLSGQNKPIYHPFSGLLFVIITYKLSSWCYFIKFPDDCGDHIVVINSREIALRGDEWKKRVYFHHTGYPRGASWTLAWELHKKDPTMVRLSSPYPEMCWLALFFSRL